jgi:thioredoxin-like negative regulator of GroEL
MARTVMNPKRLTAAAFEQEVLQSSKPVLVDFWAE